MSCLRRDERGFVQILIPIVVVVAAVLIILGVAQWVSNQAAPTVPTVGPCSLAVQVVSKSGLPAASVAVNEKGTGVQGLQAGQSLSGLTNSQGNFAWSATACAFGSGVAVYASSPSSGGWAATGLVLRPGPNAVVLTLSG